MSDYDFDQLDDKEFEILCTDLIGEYLGQRIERFKPGRDGGVDGRFFTDFQCEVVIQCKHWSRTPTKSLINHLKTKEIEKIKKLKPCRYILAVSNPLSRYQKSQISKSFEGYVKSESDIFGREDLNDLIRKYPNIEKRHYKLWLKSSNVLNQIMNWAINGRSQFSIKEILAAANKYVVTKNHKNALEILEKLSVVIISGEPGIGKTTLANHLCLHYVAQGFAYYKLSHDIQEAEDVFGVEDKQVFYFDDFLGRNYLEALTGHEGAKITHFINRVSKNKNKRFVLTSRSTILNQGKLLIDTFEHANLKRNEYELRITNLSDFDKAKILYGHIWHSGIESRYIDELYQSKRYLEVVKHKNYNPRLISYITDPDRLEGFEPENYWIYVSESLKNPADIWENPFVAQLDDFSRVVVLLVVMHGHWISESDLNRAYLRFIALPASNHLKGKPDFLVNVKLLTGCFINRIVHSSSSDAAIGLFNPSIADYVIRRYSRDSQLLKNLMICLRTELSLRSLKGLKDFVGMSDPVYGGVCREILRYASLCNFEGFSASYLSILLNNLKIFPMEPCSRDLIRSSMRFILDSVSGQITGEIFDALRWGISCKVIDELDVVNLFKGQVDRVKNYDALSSLCALLNELSEHGIDKLGLVSEVCDYVYEMVSENFGEWVDVNWAFCDVSYGDYNEARRNLQKPVEEVLRDIGVPYGKSDVEEIIRNSDVSGLLHSYHEGLRECESYDDEDDVDDVEGSNDREVEDLFDRSENIVYSVNGES